MRTPAITNAVKNFLSIINEDELEESLSYISGLRPKIARNA